LNVGSLFAGIGGFDLGLETAGFEICWQVEIDRHCRAVLERRFPRARRFEDVRTVGADTLDPVDVICGGFPCQDLSNAGKGAGIDGARSGLWSEFARIVRELRPRYVLVENVPALLTGKGKRWDRAPIGRVLGDLAEIGYDAEWSVLSAREFGAPHLRKRVWIVAYRGEGTDASGDRRRTRRSGGSSRLCEDGKRLEAAGMADAPRHAEARTAAPARSERERAGSCGPAGRARTLAGTADPHRRRGEDRCGVPEGQGEQALPDPDRGGAGDRREAARSGCQWAVEPDVGRVAHGVPDRVERLAALGNALVPQIAEWIGRRILAYEAESLSGARKPTVGGLG
jgi:DNA (cytosine-5)-methyltransferase 1